MGLDEYKSPTNLESSPKELKPTIGGRIFTFLFGLIFFAVGCGIVWHLGFKPLMIRQKAQKWPAVSAIIEKSGIRENRDSDGTTYGFDVLYKYFYKGKEFKSSKYNITNISSSDYGAAAHLRDKYPVGSNVRAYVNPDDPYYALMVRESSWSDYFGFFFLMFCFFGGFIMWAAIVGKNINARRIDHVQKNNSLNKMISS